MIAWLPDRRFSIDLKQHQSISDVEVLTAIRQAYSDIKSPQHGLARRIQCREHFRRFFEAAPSDKEGGKLIPGKIIAEAAENKFGQEQIRYDYIARQGDGADISRFAL